MKRILLFLFIFMICFSVVSVAVENVIYKGDNTNGKQIALTFDDGPHKEYTEQILDILDDYNIKATFYVIGVNAEAHPEILQMISQKGHEIGNHTYSHIDCSKTSFEKIRNDIITNHNVIKSICNVEPTTFRTPGGIKSDQVSKIADEMKYKIVFWNIDTKDWMHSKAVDIQENILTNVSDGSIILFHDYIYGETNTCEALKITLPKLIEKGYKFVTVSELLYE